MSNEISMVNSSRLGGLLPINDAEYGGCYGPKYSTTSCMNPRAANHPYSLIVL